MILVSFIHEFDSLLFHLINKTWSHQILDTILIPIRDKNFWIPLYIIIATMMVFIFRKKSIYIILLCIASFGATDQISASILKPNINRIRPCNDPAFSNSVVLRIDSCGVGKSFPSAHATNTFGFAMILSLIFRKKAGWIAPVSFLWAFLISYAQIYVGVHYPTDIIAGAFLGTLISYCLFRIASKYLFLKVNLIL